MNSVHLHVTGYGWGWLAWVLWGAGYEILWLIYDPRNTLSDQVWAIEDINFSDPWMLSDWTWLHWTIAIVIWLLLLWLLLHLPFGILR